MNLLEQKYGQALQMTICEGAETNAEDCGHWYSPDAVKQIVNLELATLREERDALAATVVELRKVANDVSIIGGVKYGDDDLMKMLANAVFSSVRPTSILAARDARVKAEALRTAGNAANNAGKFDVCWSLHAMADAIEKGE